MTELQKEANVSKLDHPNIVALFATVSEPGHYGIVMEYVLRGALDDYILSNNVCCSFVFLYKCIHICTFQFSIDHSVFKVTNCEVHVRHYKMMHDGQCDILI